MTMTAAATRRWFNDTKIDGLTLAEAFVITFLYEYLTKDDDDVAAAKLNEFIKTYAEVLPELQAENSSPDNIIVKQFKKEKMGTLRERIKDDRLGFVDNGAYKRILDMCRYMFADPVGRRHYYNLIHHMDDIVYEDPESGESTKGHISSAPASTTKETWGMPDVGDDGGTEVTKLDWVIFSSIANATGILSKGALDRSIEAKLLDKSGTQDYDEFLSKVDRFFKPKGTAAEYNTITTETLYARTSGRGRERTPSGEYRRPGRVNFIALQYPLSTEHVHKYAAQTILWKVKKKSDGSLAPADQPKVPYILTDEAIELVDWSQVTGKLLTLDDNVQYWHPEKRPENASTPGARRVVGDEKGNLKPEGRGGMVRIVKEGFTVDGTASYTPDMDIMSPNDLIMAGLGYEPAADQWAKQITAGRNANDRYKALTTPGGSNGWKTFDSSGRVVIYKWGDGSSASEEPIGSFKDRVLPYLVEQFRPPAHVRTGLPTMLENKLYPGRWSGSDKKMVIQDQYVMPRTTEDVYMVLKTTGEIKFGQLVSRAPFRPLDTYRYPAAEEPRDWNPALKFGNKAEYLAYRWGYHHDDAEESGLAAASVYTSRIIARVARCYPDLINKLLAKVLVDLLAEEAKAAEDTGRDTSTYSAPAQPEVEVEGLKPFDLQCFLIQNIRNLTKAKDTEIQQRVDSGKGAYENLSVIVDLKNQALQQGTESDGASVDRGVQPGNMVSYIHHGGPEQTQKVNALLSLCPDAYAVLQPYIKIYRVDYKGDDTLVPYREVEIPFPTFIDPKDIEQITNGTLGRYSGAGIKSFSWKLDGVNPAEVENNITALLQLRFQTLQDLFSLNQNLGAGGDEPGYLDLIIGSGTSFRETPVESPKSNPRSTPGCAEFLNESYDGARFRIKAAVGWSTPPGFANMPFRNFQKTMPGTTLTYGQFLQEAIEDSRTGLYLQVTGHELNFNEDGGVDLQVRYQAELDGILKAPNADIFVGGTEFDETLKELRKALKASDEADAEYIESNQDKTNEIDRLSRKREKKLEKMAALTTKNKAFKYKRFLCNLYERSQIYMLRVPVDELRRIQDMTPEERATLANNRLDPNGNFADIDLKAQRASETDVGSLILGAERAVRKATKNRQNPKNLKGVNKSVIRSLRKSKKSIVEPEFLDVPYFYLGDLIDGVLSYLRNVVDTGSGLDGSFQLLLSNIEILDPLLAFKYPEVSISCGDTDGQIIQRALADIDPLRFKNSHMLSFYTNIGSLPISLEYFQEWFVNNIVRPQRETYSFINFIKQICNSLIGRAFNSKCFGDTLNFNLRFDTANFVLADSFTSQLVSPADVARSKFAASKKASLAMNQDEGDTPNIPSLVVYSPNSRPSVSKSEIENVQNGIYTHYIGGSCGLSKKISFHKTDMPYMREARLQREGSLSALQLRELYNVSIDMVGNNLHRNGQYIKVDPTAIGVGSFDSLGSIANAAQLLGIGGYYLVSSVSHTISRNGFDVKVAGLQEGINLDSGTLVAIHEFEGKKADPKTDPDG